VSVRNEDVSQRMIRELREELEELKAQMAKMKESGEYPTGASLTASSSGGGGGAQGGAGETSEEEAQRFQEMQDKIALLEDTKRRQWDEVQKLSEVRIPLVIHVMFV